MGNKTRKITLSALFSSLTVIMLYIASIWPTGQVGLVAVASLFTAAAVIEAGLVYGISVYILSSILGMLLIPNRVAAIIYVLFFGYYPVVKRLIERTRWRVLQWALKLLVFNAAAALVWFILKELIIGYISDTMSLVIFILGGNIVFVLFDYGFTKVIRFYISRISGLTRKRK